MKQLITGGCSFSECKSPWIETWPKHLADALPDYYHTSTGVSSQGNGLISRQIIYQVTESLQHSAADDLLVGIMWSGPERHDFYVDQHSNFLQSQVDDPHWETKLQKALVKFVKDSQGGWEICNHHWHNQISKTYYKQFHTYFGSLIYTLEHILRTQWFLQHSGIKYFMTTYTGEVLPEIVHIHNDMKHLSTMIDTTCFLPVVGEYEWCRDYSGVEFPVSNDNHPGTQQHKQFVEKVVVPFLKERNMI